MTIIPENHECVQSKNEFSLWVFILDDNRFFATEDIDYLLQSPDTLTADDTTVILEWDRNSSEAPFIGPDITSDISSPLFIHRVGSKIQLESETDTGRQVIYVLPYESWVETIKKLNK